MTWRLARRLKGGRLMRSPSKGAIYRRLALVVLAIAVLGLVAVPLASAAPTVPCLVFGSVQGHFYGGNRALPAEVAVFDPSNAILGETITPGGATLFELVVDVPLPLYTETIKVDTETLGPKALDSSKADWTTFFTKNPQSFEPMYNTPGDFAYSPAVPLVLQVRTTTVNGVVTNATTKKALKGVKVTVGNKSVTTSTKGKYSLAIGLWPATKYRATFAKKGFYSVVKTFSSAPGSGVSVSVALKAK
jgi:hypothetical protein